MFLFKKLSLSWRNVSFICLTFNKTSEKKKCDDSWTAFYETTLFINFQLALTPFIVLIYTQH